MDSVRPVWNDRGMKLLVVLLLFSAVAGAVILAMQRADQRRKHLSEFGLGLGLRFVPSAGLGQPDTAQGVINGVSVVVALHERAKGTPRHCAVRASAQVSPRLWLGRDRLGAPSAEDPIVLGDPLFDDAVRVGGPLGEALAVLDGDTRRELLPWLIEGDLRVSDGIVLITMADWHDLDTAVARACATCERLALPDLPELPERLLERALSDGDQGVRQAARSVLLRSHSDVPAVAAAHAAGRLD